MAREKYKNLSGNSGADSFEIFEDAIHIVFEDGSEYRYSEKRPGKAEIDRLKVLAKKGQGLCSYISANIKKNYERKIR